MTWTKSSYSAGNGNCVEVEWRKSSYSADTAACVEVATQAVVRVRDSKDPDGPILTFEPAPWMDFVWGIKNGQFAPP